MQRQGLRVVSSRNGLLDCASAGDAAAGFAQCMAEVDALQALRLRDPGAALAQLQARHGQWPALQPAERALLHARLALQAGAAHAMLGDMDTALRELDSMDRSLALPELAAAAEDLRLQARRCGIAGANVRASVAHAHGDFAGALRAYLQALELARAIGDSRFQAHLLTNVACTFEECGLPTEALAHSRQALVLAQALGMDELQADIHHNIGNSLAASGHLEQGLLSNQRALAAYAALALPQKQGYALVALAERHLELGQFVQARQALDQRAGLQGSFVNPQYEAYTAYLRGRIAAAEGHDGEARAAFASALRLTAGQLGDVVGQARSLLELARLDAAAGQACEARGHVLAALALVEGTRAVPEQMRAHELLSRIAKAEGHAEEALQHHEAFHACYATSFNDASARRASLLAVRHEVDLARADAQRQRVENARLTEALAEIAARLDQRPAARAQVSAQPVQARDLQALGLTAREAEVLFWVSQGKTNEDVTVLLGIGVSAVKKHLARVFDKLGVENRTAAASAARRLLG